MPVSVLRSIPEISLPSALGLVPWCAIRSAEAECTSQVPPRRKGPPFCVLHQAPKAAGQPAKAQHSTAHSTANVGNSADGNQMAVHCKIPRVSHSCVCPVMPSSTATAAAVIAQAQAQASQGRRRRKMPRQLLRSACVDGVRHCQRRIKPCCTGCTFCR